MSARPGWVYLVGAGPGDPGLITRRGLELLGSCDVVLYDRLVAPSLLEEARAGAEIVFVGKTPGETHSRQVVSDALLVTRPRAGRSVVRLKGGDPFVFGRGGEEALLLSSSDIPFEVVPGVSSAIAVPAYAGIPVTHRGASASFVVLTGREETETAAPEALTIGADTIVLLMGVAALERTAARLIDGGRDVREPAAAIAWGTTGRQQVVVGDLGTIAGLVREQRLPAPATTVIGSVVGLRERLAWFERRPLLGRTVAVTRPRRQAAQLVQQLEGLGAEVVALPLIEIAGPETWEPLDAAIKALAHGDYDWALFSSVNAVNALRERLERAGVDARAFAGCRIAAVGSATSAALAELGLRPDLVAEPSTAVAAAAAIGEGTGRVLLPRVAGAPDEPPALLRASGWVVDDVVAYRNVPGHPDEAAVARVRDREVGIVTFTSRSTVDNFVTLVGPATLLKDVTVVSIGPSTTSAAAAQGIDVAATAQPHDVGGLVEAIVAVATTTG
ncbi:MAG TPA: uroporphyrinogen-III C-methyltransferase [Actinomycetota bacterium]|nr:uroporphyrinogen-III C-methyltransferase [Actinomycetota bacterium]